MELSRISIGSAVLFSFFLLSSLMIPLVFGSSENWVEVDSFEGTNSTSKLFFPVDYEEWRIRWSYNPNQYVPPLQSLQFKYYLYTESGSFVDALVVPETPIQAHSGIMEMNGSGTFYLNINLNANSYLVIVEQNIDSIPEFLSWTILPLILVFAIFLVIIKRHLEKTKVS